MQVQLLTRKSPSAIALGFVFLAVALGLLALAREQKPPFFGSLKPEVDLGDLNQKQEVAATFELVNWLPKKVAILRSEESCGCSKLYVPKKDFSPGDTGIIKLTWNTGASRGPSELSVAIEYAEENGDRKWLNLVVKARINPEIEISPVKLSFSEKGGIQEQTVVFLPGRVANFRLLEAKCSHRAFNCSLSEAERTVRVAFDPKEWRREDSFVAFLVVRTDCSIDDVLRVRLAIE